MYAQRLGYVQKVTELHLLTGFHPLDGGPVEPGCVGEAFLGHVLAQPSYPDAVADASAGVEDPLGLIGCHAINRLRIKIISQQQI